MDPGMHGTRTESRLLMGRLISSNNIGLSNKTLHKAKLPLADVAPSRRFSVLDMPTRVCARYFLARGIGSRRIRPEAPRQDDASLQGVSSNAASVKICS